MIKINRFKCWQTALIVFLVAFLSCVGIGLSSVRVDPTPKKEVRNLVNQVLDVLRDPKLKAPDKAKLRRQKLRNLVEQIFDLNEIAHRVLGRYNRRFTKKQFEEFKELFAKMLESIYLTRIEHYSGEKVIFEEERMLSPTKVAVPTKIIKDGQEIPVEYRLLKRRKDGKWIGYDVVIEGVSLVKNYRSQFYQVLKKKDVNDLLSMMRDKVKHLSEENKSAKAKS